MSVQLTTFTTRFGYNNVEKQNSVLAFSLTVASRLLMLKEFYKNIIHWSFLALFIQGKVKKVNSCIHICVLV